MFADEERKAPTVLGVRTLSIALALHAALFLVAYLFAVAVRKPKETVIPIDMTVVVHGNLDGNENEPPPMKPPPPQPKPEPRPEPKPTPPPVVEPKVDALVKIPDKPKPKKPKEVKKPKPPEKPKKTKEQLLKEKLERIRKAGKVVNHPTRKTVERQPNGRTGKKTLSEAELQKYLALGAKPGAVEQLPSGEYQRCVSLIRQTFYSKWDRPPWTDTLREMHLQIRLGPGGRILGYKLVRGSGDSRADATVLQAASLVKSIAGLSPEFIAQSKGEVTIRFKVTPQ